MALLLLEFYSVSSLFKYHLMNLKVLEGQNVLMNFFLSVILL